MTTAHDPLAALRAAMLKEMERIPILNDVRPAPSVRLDGVLRARVLPLVEAAQAVADDHDVQGAVLRSSDAQYKLRRLCAAIVALTGEKGASVTGAAGS